MSASSTDNALFEALHAVHAVLETESVPHALCGGIAANLYRDDLRATTDVDIYIACASPQLVSLARAFEDRGWIAHPAWRKAELLRLEHERHPRVDLLVAATDIENAAIERAVVADVDGESMRVLRAEDLLVFKLVAGRFKDYDAAAAIINSRGKDLDEVFIVRTLAELGMEDRWDRAREAAELEAQDRG